MAKHPCATPILIDPLISMPAALLRRVLAGPAYRLSLAVPHSKWGALYPMTLVAGGIGWMGTLGFVELGFIEQGSGGNIEMEAHRVAGFRLFSDAMWPTFLRPSGYFLLGRIVV